MYRLSEFRQPSYLGKGGFVFWAFKCPPEHIVNCDTAYADIDMILYASALIAMYYISQISTIYIHTAPTQWFANHLTMLQIIINNNDKKTST